MDKRIVILYNKATGEETAFPSVATLVRRTSEESIGIGQGALYNALCLNGGNYENQRVKIYYKRIDIKTEAWE